MGGGLLGESSEIFYCLLLKIIGEQQELVLGQLSDIKPTQTFQLLIDLLFIHPRPPPNTGNQKREMAAGDICTREILENNEVKTKPKI